MRGAALKSRAGSFPLALFVSLKFTTAGNDAHDIDDDIWGFFFDVYAAEFSFDEE
jgi:hypothetical protein